MTKLRKTHFIPHLLLMAIPIMGYANQMNQNILDRENLSANDITLHSYESCINEYVANTPNEIISGDWKDWLDRTLSLLDPNAHIIEIGSGFGRDAQYIENRGFTVERTDAAAGFVNLLQQNGHSAHLFNILVDDFTSTYDLVFANAVFLHFTPQELQGVLAKINASLKDQGVLAFSLKKGEGEEWTTVKLGQPRYFCYWSRDRIQRLLESNGFAVVSISEDEKFLQIIAKRSELGL